MAAMMTISRTIQISATVGEGHRGQDPAGQDEGHEPHQREQEGHDAVDRVLRAG